MTQKQHTTLEHYQRLDLRGMNDVLKALAQQGLTRVKGQHQGTGVFIQLVSTPCHYGGVRWWLECPHCHKLRYVMRFVPNQQAFICQTCLGKHRSSQSGKTNRGINTRWKIIEKYRLDEHLGLDALTRLERCHKPPRIHYRTWGRVCEHYNKTFESLPFYAL